MKAACGKVFKFGDNVDTDVIIPARYLNSSDPKELAQHCMEDIDADFVKKVSPGDLIVATKNFGCGSSREHAPLAIKAAGVSCVIAETLPGFFTATPSTSDCPSSSVRRRRRTSPTATRWKWILTAAGLPTRPRERPIRDRRFRLSCRRLSTAAAW